MFGSGDSGWPYLALKNVSMSFGSKLVLNNVTFEVMPGETVWGCPLG